MSQQHPYSASVSPSEQKDIQQSLFPSFHHRRRSHTAEMILDEGHRKSGSFEALQDLVQEKQRQQDEQWDKEMKKEDDNVSRKLQQDAPSISIDVAPEEQHKEDIITPKIRRSVRFDQNEPDDSSNFLKQS